MTVMNTDFMGVYELASPTFIAVSFDHCDMWVSNDVVMVLALA